MLQIKQEFFDEIDLIMSGEKALSYSALRQFNESPLHFYRYKTTPKTTNAMDEGIILHCMVLQPEIFKEKYFVLDDSKIVEELSKSFKNPRATKDYKSWALNEMKNAAGKDVVKLDVYNKLKYMSDYLSFNSATKIYIENIKEAEQPFEFEFEHEGFNFKIKGYIDAFGENEKGRFIADLKKVDNAKYKKLRWKIEDDSLDLQSALYCYAKQVNNYALLCIDNDCNTNVIILDHNVITDGWNKFENSISEFIRCAEENAWLSSYEFYNGGHTVYS